MSILILGFFFSACASTTSVLLDDSYQYAPSVIVRILETPPSQPYRVIAQLETTGPAGESIPSLLENMRNEARQLGADAIIPVELTSKDIQPGLIYNPWLGGYQTIGGGRFPIVRGYAIILESSISDRARAYRPPRVVGFGASANTIPLFLNGYGFGAWIGKKRFRAFGEYYTLDSPSVLLVNGFEDGRVENAIRVGGDYFFMSNLSGLFFSSGFEYSSISVSHTETTERGDYETVDFSAGLGYLLPLTSFLHIEFRLALDAMMIGEEKLYIVGREYIPSRATPSAFVGLGINY